jgi:hypothetical protein
MKVIDKYMIRDAIQNTLLTSVFLGGAWSVGFMLGFG